MGAHIQAGREGEGERKRESERERGRVSGRQGRHCEKRLTSTCCFPLANRHTPHKPLPIGTHKPAIVSRAPHGRLIDTTPPLPSPTRTSTPTCIRQNSLQQAPLHPHR
mmetsp:Transcript_8061/g.22895  ORF Transcript_8061/g.22895 Transcript_8061/m.22895 type:complete len:108 (-) Transcript_8061:164-487(-)